MIERVRHELRRLRRAAVQRGRGCLGSLGLADLTAQVLGREGAIILMYHSVADPATGHWIDPANQVSIGRFRSHMNFLAADRSVVSLSELVRMLTDREPIPRKTVAITFDDGYLDAVQHAAPIMQSLNLPATFYLPTRYIDEGQTQWIDCLYSAFARRTRQSLSIDDQSVWDLSHTGSHSFRKAYAECSRRLLALDMRKRQTLVDQIVKQLAPSAMPPRLTATWDEIRTCAEQCPLIEFGGHTREHIDQVRIEPILEQAQRAAHKERAQQAGSRVGQQHQTFSG